jgi:hypothetical protein
MKALLLGIFVALSGAVALAQESTADRTFLIVGEPNAAAWEFMIDNPGDREASMSGAIAKLGGEMLSYYWGLGDGKNYITIHMPDDPGLIQALYVTRLGDNLLSSYQMIELISSPDMAKALARVPEVKAVDDLQ